MAVIPTVDRNGNTWSDEQMDVLDAFAEGLDAYTQDGTPFSIAIDAVAGSGKTSLLQGMCHITAHLAPQLLTAMTAFNTHISESSKEILLEFKTKAGLNVKILGGSNTVNAGGHGMITSKARSEGFSRVALTKFGNDRYARIARITLSGWLAREDRLSLLEQVQEITQEKATSSTFNNLINPLVEVATMAMDEGYVPSNTIRNTGRFENDVCTCGTNLAPQPCQSWSCISKQYTPPTVHSDDIAALIEVIDKVGVNQGWFENNARNLGDQSVYQLVVEILAVVIETAYLKTELRPYCGSNSPMSAIIPNKNRQGYPDSAKPLSKCIYTTDPAIQETAKFAALETAGCRWPPAEKKENSISAKSFKTEAKCIVKEYSGHTIMSFENGGHKKRLGDKTIGTQFGFKGNYSVNGERVSSWRKFNQNLGVTVINPKDLKKVIKLLSDTFGDEFDNQLEGDVTVDDVETVTSNGVCYLSMADQIYLPHALDLQIAEHEKADVVFIDEVQDLSILKAELVWRLVKDNAIKVIVGDFKQAIYAFCGADNDAFKTNAEKIGATFYPNTICWRGTAMVAASARVACKNFVSIARGHWGLDMDVPDYQAHRSPLEAGYDWPKGALPAQITADEIVTAYHESRRLHGEDVTFGLLCRVKRPLASFIKVFLKNGIPVSTPSGKDGIVKQAFALANRAQSNTTTRNVNAKSRLGLGWKDLSVPNQYSQVMNLSSTLLFSIDEIRTLLRAKYIDLFKGDTQALAQSTEYQEMQGDLELLEAFVMLWSDSGDSLSGKNISEALMNWVNNTLFSERGGNAVHIATIHKYKGDEADIMFVVNSMTNDSEDPDAPKTIDCFMNKRSLEASKESAINEINMGYVAFTRAKKQNIIINADLQGVQCTDAKKRLEAYYNADWDVLMNGDVGDDE